MADALTERREFLRTAGVYREDGSYEVTRRMADSTGNSKVFERFEHVRRLYDRLPDEIGAETVGKTGITGSRRHALVWHFVEHPAFDCELTSRSPLLAEKCGDDAGESARTEESGENRSASVDKAQTDSRPEVGAD